MTAIRIPAQASLRRHSAVLAAAAALVVALGVVVLPRLPGDTAPGLGTGMAFQSERYAYEVVVPADWTVNEIAGTWTYGSIPLPGFPGTDEFKSPATADPPVNLFVWSTVTPAGTTLASFLEGYDAQVLTGLECAAAPQFEPITVAAHDARLARAQCTVDGVALRLRETVVVTADRVYIVAMDMPAANSSNAQIDAMYRSVIESFRIAD